MVFLVLVLKTFFAEVFGFLIEEKNCFWIYFKVCKVFCIADHWMKSRTPENLWEMMASFTKRVFENDRAQV